MKIYTKGGDKGKTSLVWGTRVSKASLRIDAYGNVDELNAVIGIVADQEVNSARLPLLKEIQDRLFTIGSNLATEPEKSHQNIPDLSEEDISLLESEMDNMDAKLPPLTNFVLPGGHPAVSFCHLARTVCRRAERRVIELADIEEVNPLIIKYLNRLSDYLFVLSRMNCIELNIPEKVWKPRLNK